MTEKRVSDLFSIKARFLRSAQLERDFDDLSAFFGYVATDFARACVARIASGLKPRSGQRAWRMTGDYGSGKSSFALLLAQLFAGRDSSLPPQLRSVVDFHQLGTARPHFVPVLVTCSREPLGTAILRGLRRALSHRYGPRAKSRLASEIQHLLDGKHEPGDDEVLHLILEANSRIIADGKGKGLLLILDELGKFLEFAAAQPQRRDVFLLQRLAEAASGSGNEPLFIVCLLHQGFNDYAEFLNQPAQREWEKVAGRFEEIIFNQPVEQIAALIASALNVATSEIPKVHTQEFKHAMEQTIRFGWFGSAPSKALLDAAVPLYPLHPTLLPVLIRTFRRFGQNERSLFSFLLSNEPFGLQAFSERAMRDAEPYRLHDFYDYVRTNFGHRLTVQSYRSHWSVIDSLMESFASEDPLQLKVLKTVGILNLLNDGDLIATEESVVGALTGADHRQQDQIRAALEKLRTVKRVLYDRGRARGLCLWPHTSVDLEKACEDARRALGTQMRVANLIKDYLETRPIVARRHYIETGNLRHYEVRYCPVMELASLLMQNSTGTDGVIIVPLCEDEVERNAALEFAKLPELEKRPHWLIAVPQPLGNLSGMVQEFQRWVWVSTNTQELNADKYAREEVTRQKDWARTQLDRRIQAVTGIKQFSETISLAWFHQTHPLRIRDGRHLLAELSRIFDETYTLAPRVHNELVNRRNLSSAAAAARMRLIERMFTHASAPYLGMDSSKKPPEMSMYLSVLKHTGLHHEHDGGWRIVEPHPRADRGYVLPALRRIREIVQKEPDNRVNVGDLFEELRKPPYGVRDGLIPVLLTVFAIVHEQEVAFFKDGTFQRELAGEALLVLTKTPERFEIQYCKIEGVRAELFEKLLAVLELKPSASRKTELLDVVKPLCMFVAQLPAFVLNTKKLTPPALAVRQAILDAREPAKLLFADLPRACGFEPFSADAAPGKSVQAFVKTLKAAIDELRVAYTELQERLRRRLRSAFDLPGSFQQFRTALAGRAQQVVLGVTEPKLKAFCLRLLDDNLAEAEWLESVGSFLALKPPAKWLDAEEDLFSQELAQLATRFHRVESIVFADGKPPKNGVGIRVAITKADGSEHEQVIHFAADEENQLRELQGRFEALLSGDQRLGLAAASRALWTNFERGGKAKRE